MCKVGKGSRELSSQEPQTLCVQAIHIVKNLRQKRYKTFGSGGITGQTLRDIRGLHYLMM